MHIVTDAGMDLSPEQLEGLTLHTMPLMIELDGTVYRSGIDITADEFYDVLDKAKGLPTTSLPAPGEFAEVYQSLIQDGDREVLSVHISSGLSGTYSAARVGAEMASEADVTVFDTMTLSAAEGWQVEAAAQAARAGVPLERTVAMLERIRTITNAIYTLPDLTYLRHGGRIGHIKGLLATVLKIKPVIGVSKTDGRYYQRGQFRTFPKALEGLAEVMAQDVAPGIEIRVQVAHARNPEGAARLHQILDQKYDCTWLPDVDIAPVLAAHTGPGLVGVIYAPLDEYPEVL